MFSLSIVFVSAALAVLARAAPQPRSTVNIIDLNSSASSLQSALSRNSYEYIIVGGGTAGLATASRLAQGTKKKSVLVIEAGGSGVGDDIVTIPKNSFSFLGTDRDWFFEIAPQEHAANQTINLSQGKILGGGSAVNGLVYVRPSKADIDALELLGSDGWNWDNLYPVMKQAENINSPTDEQVSEYDIGLTTSSLGSGGPLQLSFPDYIPLQHQKLIAAGVELGHTLNEDSYGGNNVGTHYSLSTETPSSAGATRETSEFAYLDTLFSSKLTTLIHATATKVNFKKTKNGQAATSVSLKGPDGKTYTAKVASGGEVILAAGVVRTPQLLELSGIGQSDRLTALGIKPIIDLPGVGENYEDHTLTLLTYALKDDVLSFDALGYNATLAAEQTALYKTKAEGWLTFAQAVTDFEPIQKMFGAEDLAKAEELLSTKPDSIPQDQFDIIKSNILNGEAQAEYIFFNSFSAGNTKEANTSYISLAITHVHPLSRGSIHITSTDIDVHPLINPNMLESEWDLWFLAKATEYGRKIMQTEAMKEILAEGEAYPGLDVVTNEDQWIQFAKENVNSGYHSVGSASMLPREKNGVVDNKLKVYGTTNLRVVDLSAMPQLVSAHTQPVAYLFGEMGAKILLEAEK
ncbi:GMC oxidoreductase [Cylindrobasidium torrendii FP15055 ss-10]|uniref:GMC oxidoreductase n=1 Tax=Cylindrobasidium torrendii FP15055 ss-10 TaxID=1314674 RepID=A0A0D7B1A6_9AGAR|nr:GMC oxidoreductase [Cylindrobasidium torrendii FP15055 ss-10]